jgi:hypothetical protein
MSEPWAARLIGRILLRATALEDLDDDHAAAANRSAAYRNLTQARRGNLAGGTAPLDSSRGRAGPTRIGGAGRFDCQVLPG